MHKLKASPHSRLFIFSFHTLAFVALCARILIFPFHTLALVVVRVRSSLSFSDILLLHTRCRRCPCSRLSSSPLWCVLSSSPWLFFSPCLECLLKVRLLCGFSWKRNYFLSFKGSSCMISVWGLGLWNKGWSFMGFLWKAKTFIWFHGLGFWGGMIFVRGLGLWCLNIK